MSLVWGSCVEVLGVGGCGCGEELCEEIARRAYDDIGIPISIIIMYSKKQ